MVFTSTRDALRVGLAALEAEAFLVWPKLEARRILRNLVSAALPARRPSGGPEVRGESEEPQLECEPVSECEALPERGALSEREPLSERESLPRETLPEREPSDAREPQRVTPDIGPDQRG
jgi:hypothetical protein